MKLDKELLLFINCHHNSFFDNIMWFASGELSWFPLYAFMIILLFIKFKKRALLMILLVIPLIIASDQLSASLLKPLIQRLRPSHEPGLENLLHYVNQYRGGLYSFPSSHACNFFAGVTYISLAAKKIKWFPYLLVPVAILVSYSRMYLGVHYPSDILGGIILGAFLGWLFSILNYQLKFLFFRQSLLRNDTSTI